MIGWLLPITVTSQYLYNMVVCQGWARAREGEHLLDETIVWYGVTDRQAAVSDKY